MRYALMMLPALFVACDPDFGEGDPIEGSCTRYCDQLASCDDETDVDGCINDCVDQANDCQADEQEQALEELDECAQESCDDIALCTVGASLECHFGI